MLGSFCYLHIYRQKLLEILNSGQYASPIIVFVNQKKTADMVAKDLSRAGVCGDSPWLFFFGFAEITSSFSGALLRCIRAKTKNSERPRCNRCAMVNRMYLLRLTLQDGVSTFKMSALSSTFKWQTRLKPTCIVLVSPSWVKMYFYGCFLGRTGRAGKLGTAITFLTNDDDEVMWVDACTYIFGWANVYLSLSFRSGTTSSKVRS